MGVHDSARDSATNEAPPAHVGGWGVAARLGIVLSIASGLIAAAFADRIATPVIVCGVLVVSSIIGWTSAERAPLVQPIRLRRR